MPKNTVIQGYYDMSGNQDRTLLAGYVAPIDVWRRFEHEWHAVLAEAVPPCRYLHMVEVMGLRDEFDKSKGWTREKADALVKKLINRCLLAFGRVDPPLVAVFCIVETADYDKACKDLPHLKQKEPVTICAEFVTRAALAELPQDPQKPTGYRQGNLELYFDRGEPFQKKVERAWEEAKGRPVGKKGPLSMITHIDSACTQETPALQAADYLAWHVNRWLANDCQGSYLRAVLPCPYVGDHLDYETLLELYGNEVP